MGKHRHAQHYAVTATYMYFTAFYLFLQYLKEADFSFSSQQKLRGVLSMSRILAVSGIYPNPYSNKPVPSIRLQGKWVEKMGFTIGKKVTVTESYGKLVLEVVTE